MDNNKIIFIFLLQNGKIACQLNIQSRFSYLVSFTNGQIDPSFLTVIQRKQSHGKTFTREYVCINFVQDKSSCGVDLNSFFPFFNSFSINRLFFKPSLSNREI